jgi:transcriptional regulator with GAF, ATPase, and Fis domain
VIRRSFFWEKPAPEKSSSHAPFINSAAAGSAGPEEQDRVVRILGRLLDRAIAHRDNPFTGSDAELPVPVEAATAHRAEARFDEQNTIIRILRDTNGRVGGPNGAAARMGLKRTTLITRMKKLGIETRRVF